MAKWYRKAYATVMNGEVDWDSDTIKFTLHTSSYTPDLDAHDYVNDLTNELGTGGGYTSGGWTVTCSPAAYTAANSWGTTRANSTAYAAGDIVRPTAGNGYLYQCVVAGTSGGSAPTYPTVIGREVTDGTVVWTNAGTGVVIIDATDVSQGSFTAGPFRYGVLSDRTPGTAATQPLIALVDYLTDKTGENGTFTTQFHANGVLQHFTP